MSLQQALLFFGVPRSGICVVELDVVGDRGGRAVGSDLGAAFSWRFAISNDLERKRASLFEGEVRVMANRDPLALGADHHLPSLRALWVYAQPKVLGARIPQRELFSGHRLGSARHNVSQ